MKTPEITFQPVASDLLPFLRAGLPAGHTIVATCESHTATGATKAEAANAAIEAWSQAEGRKLAAAAYEANL
jgi:hypothetical protein